MRPGNRKICKQQAEPARRINTVKERLVAGMGNPFLFVQSGTEKEGGVSVVGVWYKAY